MATASTTGVTGNSYLNSLTGTKANKSAEDPENRFLTLLVNQMKNQDPLNPMENAEVTSQLAQISTVSGIDKLNKTLESMSGAFSSAQSMQAGNLIGRYVTSQSDSVVYQGQPIPLGFALDATTASGTLVVKNDKGKVVHTEDFKEMTSGRHDLWWNGDVSLSKAAASGRYTYDVSSVDATGKATSVAKDVAFTYDGSSIQLPIDATSASGTLKLTIKNSNGETILQKDLGASSANASTYAWQGDINKATGGIYRFEVSTLGEDGKKHKVEKTYGFSPVDSVSLANGLTVNTVGMGAVPFSSIESVL
ncbi:MAG: hypothetical protein IPK20_14475 [Betaproteobacteria bacterium]|nr:hypothetical protein [Betaproteobacteria bacterium]